MCEECRLEDLLITRALISCTQVTPMELIWPRARGKGKDKYRDHKMVGPLDYTSLFARVSVALYT